MGFELPPKERRRLVRGAARGGTELDATHPILPVRTAFAGALPDPLPTVVLRLSDSQRSDAELARLDVPLRRALIGG